MLDKVSRLFWDDENLKVSNSRALSALYLQSIIYKPLQFYKPLWNLHTFASHRPLIFQTLIDNTLFVYNDFAALVDIQFWLKFTIFMNIYCDFKMDISPGFKGPIYNF